MCIIALASGATGVLFDWKELIHVRAHFLQVDWRAQSVLFFFYFIHMCLIFWEPASFRDNSVQYWQRMVSGNWNVDLSSTIMQLLRSVELICIFVYSVFLVGRIVLHGPRQFIRKWHNHAFYVILAVRIFFDSSLLLINSSWCLSMFWQHLGWIFCFGSPEYWDQSCWWFCSENSDRWSLRWWGLFHTFWIWFSWSLYWWSHMQLLHFNYLHSMACKSVR